MWPGYALRSLGLLFAVAAVLVLLGGLVQINPVWQWGPYELDRATNGAQPDWYLGWLIGGLRLMPPLEIRVFGHTLVPNPFWGGIAFPGVVFATLDAVAVRSSRAWCATARATTCSTARAITRGARPSASPSSAGWR